MPERHFFGSHDDRQFRAQQLEGDEPAVPEVPGEVDCGHPAVPELALDKLAVPEGSDQ